MDIVVLRDIKYTVYQNNVNEEMSANKGFLFVTGFGLLKVKRTPLSDALWLMYKINA